MAKEGWLELESDPGVFTLLVKALGVEGVQVEEIYDLGTELQEHVYGFIFLFAWSDDRRARRRYSAIPDEMLIRDPERLRRMFFARQIITNSCATHALLSVMLNTKSPTVALGPTLTTFKDDTRDLDAELKGFSIGNVPQLSEAHNKHSRPEPISTTRAENNGAFRSRSEAEQYHYISFVPIEGRLVELDGLKANPIDHGPIPAGQNWTTKFFSVLRARLATNKGEGSQDIRYNLLAVVDDRIDMCNRKLHKLEAEKEALLAIVEQTFCSLVASPVATPLESPSSPVHQHIDIASTVTSSEEVRSQAVAPGSPDMRPLSPATEGLVPEPMQPLHETHDQPVCGSTASSFAPASDISLETQSIAATALSLHTGRPLPRALATRSNLQASSSTLSGSSLSLASTVSAASTSVSNNPAPPWPGSSAAAETGVADSHGKLLSPNMPGYNLSPPLAPTTTAAATTSGVDPVKVSAALYSSLSCAQAATHVAASTSAALEAARAPSGEPVLSTAPAASTTVSLPDAPALLQLAELAPSPMHGSPVRAGSALDCIVATAAATTVAGCSDVPMEESDTGGLHHRMGIATLDSEGGGAASDSAPLPNLPYGSVHTPRVSVTRSSTPEVLASSLSHAMLQEMAARGGGDAAAAGSDEEMDIDKENAGVGGGGRDILTSSCAALATSLSAYSGGETAALSTPFPASGTATPGGGLHFDDARHAADVTRAAHVLVSVLRRGGPESTEQLPQGAAMLEHAVAPLRRDDPDTTMRVTDIFKKVGEMDTEISACRKLLSDEEDKRQQYRIDHSRRTHNYGPFISTFLVMLAKEGLLKQIIETEHPARAQPKQRTASVTTPAAGGSAQTTSKRGRKKAPPKETAAASSSATPATPAAPARRGRPGRPPGSKTKKKKGVTVAAASSSSLLSMDYNDDDGALG